MINSSVTCQAPFRSPPTANPTVYTSAVVDASPVYARETDQGRIVVATTTHASGFNTAQGFTANVVSTSPTAGACETVTVTAVDANGNRVINYIGIVHFTSSDGQAILPEDYLFTAADAGQHTFTFNLETVGPQSLTVTDTDLASMTTTVSGISVVAAQMIGNYLVVGGTTGNDSIVFTPGTTPGSLNVTLNATNLGTFSPANSVVIYGNGGTDNVTVNGTSGNDAFTLYPKDVVLNGLTFQGNGIALWNVNGAAGNDSFVVDQLTPANIDGGSGTNTCRPGWLQYLGDHGHRRGSLGGTISFQNVANLTGGTGNNDFQFGPSGSLAGKLNGGGGNNTLDYSASGNVVTVALNATGGSGTLIGGGFSNVQKLIGSPAGTTLDGPPSVNLWQINGINTGMVNNTLSFAGVQNLIGSSQADTFAMLVGGQMTGTLDGKGGTNTIDYSKATGPVTVNLASNSSTGVGVAAFANIQSIIGTGAAGDTLIGPNATNTWYLTGANACYIGLNCSYFANLTGGNQSDLFEFLAGSSVSGTISGGGGSDTLNYAHYGQAVSVNLRSQTATAPGFLRQH